jgi:hypothetical protein
MAVTSHSGPPTVHDVSQYIRALTKGRWRSEATHALNEADGAELAGIDPENLERLIARLALGFHRGSSLLSGAEHHSDRPQAAADQDKSRHGNALSNDFP